jgi:two-component system chemotaxis response regulator CheY
MRLLVVEDSALIRTVTRLAFPSKDHEIQDAGDGRQALALRDAASHRFDAILLDLRMPEMNGVEFLRELRKRPRHRDTAIVVATSEADTSELVQEARRLGVAAVVKKPWKPQELAQLVQTCIERRPG